MIHGLNLKPEKMLLLAHDLEDMGLSVLNVKLSGHYAGSDWNKVSRSQWLSEIKANYDLVKTEADQNHAPLYLVAYSLGAVLTIDLMEQDSSVRFQKAILFSPALEIHGYTYLLKILNWAPSLKIPSLSPKDYRFHNGTSIAAYKALFQSVSAVHRGNVERVKMQTTVIIDPKDELVSFVKLKNFIQDNNLSGWTILPISNQGSTLARSYHHLTVDSAAVGETQWKNILNTIQFSFREKNLC